MQPLLSAGIIFKNEIRCLERCLRSLQPLREQIPMEIVMADTGSDDGSREAAEKYADILFDFPWINDFAAARNAVMDRCSGEWYLSIDADEWLDEDRAALVGFLRDPASWKDYQVAGLTIRNYTSERLADGQYGDFHAIRMCRLSAGIRFAGAIHETFTDLGKRLILPDILLHHDGYVNFSGAKRARNLALLRQGLREPPETSKELLRWLQYVESSEGKEQEENLRKTVRFTEEKRPGWEQIGPHIFRVALNIAGVRNWPEVDEWYDKALALFPGSIVTRVDLTYYKFTVKFNRQDYEEAVGFGERYLAALKGFQRDGDTSGTLVHGAVYEATPLAERTARLALSNAYCHMGRYRESLEMLDTMDAAGLPAEDMLKCAVILREILAESGIDAAAVITRFWEKISRPVPTAERAKERRDAFVSAVFSSFSARFFTLEDLAWALSAFRGLGGEYEIGRAAAIFAETDPEKLTDMLAQVTEWSDLMQFALAWAVRQGAAFPATMTSGEMDRLASQLAQKKLLADAADLPPVMEDDCRAVCWRRALVFGAVESFDWAAAEVDVQKGLALARAFAGIERLYLPLCYSGHALSEDGLFLLPDAHRFGWYLVQAIDAMDAGDAPDCARLLRLALKTYGGMKNLVEFLLDHAPALQTPDPAPELLALAEKVRTILAAYPPDDPAVLELKKSDIYQKVAWIIEKPAGIRGLKQ